jgi:PAS domain S-box-containing protein
MKVVASHTSRRPFVRTEQELADFVDNGAVGLHWVAADGVILWANRSDYEFLGYSAEEYIGRSIRDFHAEPAVVADILERLAAGMTIVDYEARLRCKDGSVRYVVITSSALFDDDGRFVHSRCFTRDITERRKLEEQLSESHRCLQILSDSLRQTAEAGLDLPAILAAITHQVADVVGDSCILRLLSTDRAWFEIRAVAHRNDGAFRLLREVCGEREPSTGGPSGEVIRAGKPTRRDDAESGFDVSSTSERIAAYLRQYRSHAVIVVPMIVHGNALGTLVAARTDPGTVYTDTDAKLVEEIAVGASLAIHSALQHEQQNAASAVARRSQEQLELVMDTIPALVSYVGADLRYRFMNSRYESWFGQSRQRMLGQSLPEVLGEAAYESLRSHVEAVLRGEPVTFEALVPYRDGGSRFVRALYIPHRGSLGVIEGYVALVEDISNERRLAAEREELLRSEKAAREHLAFLANASAVLTASLDYNETLKNVVGLMLPMLGDFGFFDVVEENGDIRRIARAYNDPKRQALLDQTRWVRSERSDMNLCALSSGQSGIHPHVDDLWLRDVAGSPAHLDVMRTLGFGSMITVPLVHCQTIRGALTLFFGDSGRRHTDADVRLAEELARRAATAVANASLFKGAQEAIAIRDDFLRVAGHELRTPLTALQLHLFSVLRMLTESGAEDGMRNRTEKALKSATRLSALVDELLDISRISAGRFTLNATTFDLVAAIREVLEQTAPDLARAGCTTTFEPEGELVGSWDRDRIQQAVTNLVLNAIKYGKGKPIIVTVVQFASTARVGIRDFGIGIPVEDQNRIFERFERAVSSRHFGGLGLGLWNARQIMERHGGTIRVESAPHQGAFFELCLPWPGSSSLAE